LKENSDINVDTVVDVIGEICPIPLIETRKAMNQSKNGEIIEIIGTHEASKQEIPMAVTSAGSEVLKVSEEEGIWHIFVRKL
jgi:tRNA 2-thiouridine synthesizing protein A